MHDEAIVTEGGTVSVVGLLDLRRNLNTQPAQGFHLKPTIEGRLLTRPTIHDHLDTDDALISVTTTSFPAIGVTVERAKAINSAARFGSRTRSVF